MKNLKEFDISLNPINWSNFSQNKPVFQKSVYLKYLNLSNTMLDSLEKIGLKNLKLLISLDASMNRIEFIRYDIFQVNLLDRGALSYLNLANNLIKEN